MKKIIKISYWLAMSFLFIFIWNRERIISKLNTIDIDK